MKIQGKNVNINLAIKYRSCVFQWFATELTLAQGKVSKSITEP